MTEQAPHVDKEARKRLAYDAKELLEDVTFLKAIIALRKRYFDTFLSAKTDEELRTMQAKLQALDEIPQQLSSFVNDQKMGEKRGN